MCRPASFSCFDEKILYPLNTFTDLPLNPSIQKMKKIISVLILSGLVFICKAQSSSGTGKTLTPSAFEATLVNGPLSLFKEFKPTGEGKEFIPRYFLRKKNDPGFNNRKPLQVALSKQSFDSVFTRTSSDMAARWPALSRYLEDNRISLTTEQGWITAITHFNNMQ